MDYSDFISAADTAKLVRKALKVSFPGVKFSVISNTYSRIFHQGRRESIKRFRLGNAKD